MSATAPRDSLSDPSIRPGYVQRQREKRVNARERIHWRVVHPITTPQSVRDPLISKTTPLRSTMTTTRVLLLAIFIHVVVLLAFLIANRFMGPRTLLAPRSTVVVQIRDVAPQPPPEPEEEDPPSEGPVSDDFAEAEPPPAASEPMDVRKNEVVIEPAPEAPDDTPPPRRIIGLSFESTVEGGDGPSFATGTSRMGRTEGVAQAPDVARKKPSGTSPAPDASPPGATREQRAASHIPTQKGVFVKPRRKTPRRPDFPATLRAQGIEGDVLVRVKIAMSGAVQDVTILQSSGHTAFDEAARQAAKSEVFAPATRDGQPIPYTLTYSYRFRIED